MNRFAAIVAIVAVASFSSAEEVPLTSLDLNNMTQGYKRPVINKSVTEKPLSIAGLKFENGVGSHAPSRLFIRLDGNAERFEAMVGLDDGADESRGSAEFLIYADGEQVYNSGVMRMRMPAKQASVPLSGVKLLMLKISEAGDGRSFDHANWVNARIVTSGAKPVTIPVPVEPKIILTPKPGPEPHLNSPLVYGCRPGHPFLYRIPATGIRPLNFIADGLPSGLKLDASTGIITGTAPDKGDHKVVFHASNSDGTTSKSFTIKSGDTLSLTPYMGWNHWYTHFHEITDAKMRAAADAMVDTGMADYGYSYVAIDDCWQRKPGSEDKALMGDTRDQNGNIIPNSHFPDMAGLTEYIHAMGLKAGIYSSPGPLTCGRYAGSMDFEAKDAKQYADWGFDLLKYDWCTYGRVAGENPSLNAMMEPYELMGGLIKQQDRDIIFNLCQYGMGDVWRWGADVGGQSWRTAGDLGFALSQIIEVAKKNVEHRAWNGPGRWNDPDYLQIGIIGDIRDRKSGIKPIPSPLTATEQYSFMSLWCLMAAPLVYSGDITQVDEFTLNILCNSEVIEVNQDPLGQCAAIADLGDNSYILVKDMIDGSKAIGLCNGGETTATLTAHWATVGVTGQQRVRDLWRHKDIGVFEGKFEAEVPRHGVKFVRLWEQ